MELVEIKLKLKERLALGLNYGLQSIEDTLVNTSVLKNEIITFKSQFNDLNRIASQGILGYEQVEIGYNRIRQALLGLIDKMENADVGNKKDLPKIQNNELQNRKENFFELLKIHFTNLENVTVKLQTSYGSEYREDLRTGRDAVLFLFNDIFRYNFTQPRRSDDVSDISIYSKEFFEVKYPRMEAYMNTLGFILEYISEAEIDQGFFFGVVNSILSSSEKIMLIYFAIGNIEPGFKKLLMDSNVINEGLKKKLIKEEHYELLLS